MVVARCLALRCLWFGVCVCCSVYFFSVVLCIFCVLCCSLFVGCCCLFFVGFCPLFVDDGLSCCCLRLLLLIFGWCLLCVGWSCCLLVTT